MQPSPGALPLVPAVPRRRPPARPRTVLAALSLGTVAFGLAQSLPIGLLPQIGADLHRSPSGTGLLVTAFSTVVLVTSVPLALLTRRLPKRGLLGVLLGVFAASALASAAAPTFELLLVAQTVTAIVLAMFWSVVTPTAAGQFPPQERSRAVAWLFTGSSLTPVIGLPALTWLGQRVGWRSSFVALAVLGVLTCALVVASLPPSRPDDEPAGTGEEPDGRRYRLVLGVILLGVGGQFTAFTYLTGHLVDVAGLPSGSIGPVLFVLGVAGVLGALANGTVLHGHPVAALVTPVAVMSGAAVLLGVGGRHAPAAIVAFCLLAMAGSAFAAALGARVLRVAPGSTVLASAGSAAVYNGGIAFGSWLGGRVVDGSGVHATAVPAAVLTAAALALLLCEPLLAPGPPLSRHDHAEV